MLPASVVTGLQTHLEQRRMLFEDDNRIGKSKVFLPDALAQKYPNAATEWCWQYIFPAGSYSLDPRSGMERRHHIDEKLLQRAMKKAVQAAGITKPGHAAYLAAFICATSAGSGLRHPHGAGIVGA